MAAFLFILGAVMVDAVRDDEESTAETQPTTTESVVEAETQTSGEAVDDAPASNLPASYVAIRSRDNPIIASNTYEEVLSLALTPGMYQVFGKIGVSNRDPQLPFTVECALVPSDRDGTPRGAARAGEAGSDYGDISLGRAGEPGDRSSIPLAISQALDAQGSVVLVCRGYGSEHGAFAHYGTIRAIEVGLIDTREAPLP